MGPGYVNAVGCQPFNGEEEVSEYGRNVKDISTKGVRGKIKRRECPPFGLGSVKKTHLKAGRTASHEG